MAPMALIQDGSYARWLLYKFFGDLSGNTPVHGDGPIDDILLTWAIIMVQIDFKVLTATALKFLDLFLREQIIF